MATRRSVVKIIAVGDTGVGKSCLISRYTKGEFSTDHKATIGIAFDTKELAVDGKSVTVQFWDTAGQERFDSLAPAYYRGADACLLVCDVTNAKSLERLSVWLGRVKQHSANESLPFAVAANKVDTPAGEHKVSEDQVKAWASSAMHGISTFMVSALDNVNVDNVMMDLVTRACSNKAAEPTFVPNTLDMSDSKKSSGCC